VFVSSGISNRVPATDEEPPQVLWAWDAVTGTCRSPDFGGRPLFLVSALDPAVPAMYVQAFGVTHRGGSGEKYLNNHISRMRENWKTICTKLFGNADSTDAYTALVLVKLKCQRVACLSEAVPKHPEMSADGVRMGGCTLTGLHGSSTLVPEVPALLNGMPATCPGGACSDGGGCALRPFQYGDCAGPIPPSIVGRGRCIRRDDNDFPIVVDECLPPRPLPTPLLRARRPLDACHSSVALSPSTDAIGVDTVAEVTGGCAHGCGRRWCPCRESSARAAAVGVCVPWFADGVLRAVIVV
jgi:hypothetical protein